MTAIAETAMSAQAAWVKVQLRSICSFLSGGTPSKQRPDFWSGSIPWVSPKDMKKPWLSEVVDHISEAALANGSTLAPAGSVFVVVRGMILARDVPVAVAEVPMAFNQDMKAIIPGPRVVPGFLLYALGAFKRNLHQKVGRSAHGTMTLMSHDLEQFEIPLPDTIEQRKIASMLGLVQQAMEQQERLVALTAELKKALLHQLFTRGLRGQRQKQTEIGPIPQSWEVVRLEDIALIERGKFTHRPRNDPRFYGGRTPFVQTGDVSNCDGRIREYSQTLNEEGLGISRVFPAGTILITIAANIGFSGILEFDSACPDSLIGVTPSDRTDPEFLQHYLSTQQPEMDRLAPRGTQKNINIQFLRPWPVRLPPRDEQREIVGCLNTVDSRIRTIRRKREALSSLFRSLLHQLMTAQIRVHDLDLPELEAATAE